MGTYVVAMDQGTTSSRAVVFDERLRAVASAQREFPQIFPQAGWVEHDPLDILASQRAVLHEAISRSGITPSEIAAVGIANQRETTVLWERSTGKPVCNAIVWQCRRTADICEGLVAAGLAPYIRDATGLVVDPYFSGTKVKWALDHIDGLRARARRGEILFGTVDAWLLWNLTGGPGRPGHAPGIGPAGGAHMTDRTNASRTMLYDIHKRRWDDTLLEALGIPRAMLPEARGSCEIFGHMDIGGSRVPIAGIAGDQQAALYGQACFEAGSAKCTYGTGCFLLMHTGAEARRSSHGLLTTVAAGGPGAGARYALEGSVFVGGAVVQWMRDGMRFFAESRDVEYYAGKVPDTGGVYVVPAFTGLGAPHWDMRARGAIVGITRGTTREHMIRAALESIAYQTDDLIRAMEKDAGAELAEIAVDGGASGNEFLMQFQADISGKTLRLPEDSESTALGAAMLAGLAVGLWKDEAELSSMRAAGRRFEPQMEAARRDTLRAGWARAVGRSLAWDEG